jgi:tyrosine-protein phosphatase SIW14
MSCSLRWIFAAGIALLLVVGPLAYSRHRHTHARNVRVVHDGVLYRSGQLDLAHLKNLVHDYGIKTVITLRDADRPGDPPPDLAEEEYCRRAEIQHIRISPQRWASPTGFVPARESVEKFLEVLDNPANHPVLVHCFAGIHRTGAMCAVYRMEYDRWPNAQAIDEVRRCGYRNLDDEWDLRGFLEDYVPRWKKSQ